MKTKQLQKKNVPVSNENVKKKKKIWKKKKQNRNAKNIVLNCLSFQNIAQ